MEETLIIKNFGPIELVELKLKRFTILIGEQATGKSTVAKVLIAIQNTVYKIRNTTLKQGFDPKLDDEWVGRYTELFLENIDVVGLKNFINSDTEILYSPLIVDSQKPYSFHFQNEKADITIFKLLTQKENLNYSIDYIPSERNLINIISDALFGLTEVGTPIPKLLLRFGNKFNKAKKESLDYSKILGVKYKYEDGQMSILLPSGKQINISEASSGFQSSIPLLIVFDYIISNENFRTDTKNYIIIEEPELNLFPSTQNELVKHLSEQIAFKGATNQANYSHHLLIITHSPYILTSLNNLLYAYKVGQEHEKEVDKIIKKKYWVNPNDVAAYRLTPGNPQQDIFDSDLNIIDAGEIDEVSESINSDWDKISNIRFARVDAN